MPVVGPRLVDGAVLRARRVGADGRCVHERLDARPRGGLEDAAAAVDVHRVQLPVVARGLDEPGEVHDGVGAAEDRVEVVVGDVGGHEPDAGLVDACRAAGDPDDLLDRRLRAQRGEQARAHVARRAGDDDLHDGGAGIGEARAPRGEQVRRVCTRRARRPLSLGVPAARRASSVMPSRLPAET